MKRIMTYEELKQICLSLADYIHNKCCPDEIIAVVRGGLTAAHIISKELSLPIGVWYPKNETEDAKLIIRPTSNKLVFIEDLVAQGRTYNELKQFMSRKEYASYQWEFIPVIVDRTYNTTELSRWGIQPQDWIVFPYEDIDRMKEGDRGFFRNNTCDY